jgi:hypothetical protein
VFHSIRKYYLQLPVEIHMVSILQAQHALDMSNRSPVADTYTLVIASCKLVLMTRRYITIE